MSGCVVWLTGLPASGKSTIAAATCSVLRARHLECVTLDGDDVRKALVPAPGYDPRARAQFYETLARLAALLADQDAIVLVAATAHLRRFRDNARTLAPAFLEVFVDTPLAECKRRDPKGLYSGYSTDLVPGVGTVYEPPERPDFVVRPDTRDAALRLATLIIEQGGQHDQKARFG